MKFIHEVSPEEYVERVRDLIPKMNTIWLETTEVQKILTESDGNSLYYSLGEGNAVNHIVSMNAKNGKNRGSYPECSSAHGILEGSTLEFTYLSFNSDWICPKTIYSTITTPIPKYEDLTEDFLFQQSLVLHEIEFYAMIVFAYSKHLDMPSYSFSPASLIHYEALGGIRY